MGGETQGRYASGSDQEWLRRFLQAEPQPDVELKRPWLDGLTAAARAGTPWRRLRIIPDPPTDYFRYQLAWSYPDSLAADELVRAIEHADWVRPGGPLPDFHVVAKRVVVMVYGDDDRFRDAIEITDPATATAMRGAAEHTREARSRPIDDWLADHPDLHRATRN